MEATEDYNNKQLVFTTPAGAPFTFTIGVNAGPNLKLQITGDNFTGALISSYTINAAEHASYLDVFAQLSADFGLRLPVNRQPPAPPAGNINYQEVLLENKAEGMRYGYGDPAVMRTVQNGRPVYYLIATSNDAPDAFPILKSENLTDWTFIGYVFPEGQKPQWAADEEMISDYWAPEMHQVGSEYRVYYVARDKSTFELCIGMATSAHPEGPFTSADEPVLKGNVIDPHIFVQDDQTTYLFWKEDNNDVWPGLFLKLLHENPALITQLFTEPHDQATASFMITLWPWLQAQVPMERFMFIQTFIEAVIARYTPLYYALEQMAETQSADIVRDIQALLHYMKTPMFARQLSADGQKLIGDRTKVLENDLEWEAHLIEGMWVTKQQNRYYLFYAGNDFSTSQYGIGVAIAEHLLGPYQKMEQPLLQSTAKWAAPGHPSVTVAPDGKPVMFLHAYVPGQAGYKRFRALLAVPLAFSPDKVTLG